MVLEDVCMDCIKVLSNVTRKPHANLLLSIAYINFQLTKAFLEGLIFGCRLQNSYFFSKSVFQGAKCQPEIFVHKHKHTSLTACLYSTSALAPRLVWLLT